MNISHYYNQNVLKRMGKEKELPITIKDRKLEYLPGIYHEKLSTIKNTPGFNYNLQKKIEGKRSVWMKNLVDWYNKTSIDIFRV